MNILFGQGALKPENSLPKGFGGTSKGDPQGAKKLN